MGVGKLGRDKVCRYFKKAGPRNTKSVLDFAASRAKELGIKRILVATCSGKTVFDALAAFDPEMSLIAISHVTGFLRPDHQELSTETREELEARGVTVLTCQHAFGGVGRGVRNKLSTYQVDEIIAYTLRIFGHGTKVAIELALMAADAGLVRTDEDVISIAGSGKGADTALVLRPTNSFKIFDLKVREIICKPLSF